MKRDMELIKKILEYVEKHGDGSLGSGLTLSLAEVDVVMGSQTYPFPVMHYHAWLCVDAGFVEGNVHLDPTFATQLSALTWRGHNALDKLRIGHRDLGAL